MAPLFVQCVTFPKLYPTRPPSRQAVFTLMSPLLTQPLLLRSPPSRQLASARPAMPPTRSVSPEAKLPSRERETLFVTASKVAPIARPTMPPTVILPEGAPWKVTAFPLSPTVSRRIVTPFTQPNRPASGYLVRSTVQAMFLMVWRPPSTLYLSGDDPVPMGTHSLMEEASMSAVSFTSPSTRYLVMEYPSSPFTARAKPTRSSAVPIPRLTDPLPAACERVISVF